MPSEALTYFQERLEEIDQLMEAHGALVRFQKASAAIKKASGLKSLSAVIDLLVSNPGAGRPHEVHALNTAAIALLSGHLQGFVVDLYAESAKILLNGKVKSVNALTSAGPVRGNPNEENITKLFATLGFAKILDGLKWGGQSNKALKDNLHEFNKLRNRIVHGKSEKVRKSKVTRYLKLWRSFAENLDKKLGNEIKSVTGATPW